MYRTILVCCDQLLWIVSYPYSIAYTIVTNQCNTYDSDHRSSRMQHPISYTALTVELFNHNHSVNSFE